MNWVHIRKVLEKRKELWGEYPPPPARKVESEGGCGVIGILSCHPIAGRHMVPPAVRMRNRGNGKGGGVALSGLLPEQWKVPREVLDSHYLLLIAFLEPDIQEELEQRFIFPKYEVYTKYPIPHREDYRESGLTVAPPEVMCYFVRPKRNLVEEFVNEISEGVKGNIRELPVKWYEDEQVYRNTYTINQTYYASLGEKKAFVLSHGKNLAVFKVVGYAEQVVDYYGLGEMSAHGWIAHQRYPTKGKVWHPGGAHPFIGLNEALVHNGDFANYTGVCTYLAQRGIAPLFLTDTEVSVLLFDLWKRTYGYPLEWVCEALAPTTERDFALLPPEKKELYFRIQTSHIGGSPDGPWFFIILRFEPETEEVQLIGITDTSMLRPQVFAYHSGKISVGMIASEKQALDAFLESLHREYTCVCPVADKYWNARGGSHTDGGAFVFRLSLKEDKSVEVLNKFGRPVAMPEKAPPKTPILLYGESDELPRFEQAVQILRAQTEEEILKTLDRWLKMGINEGSVFFFHKVKNLLTALNDFPFALEKVERKWFLYFVRKKLNELFDSLPYANGSAQLSRVDYATRKSLVEAESGRQELYVDATEFPSEGEESLARFLAQCVGMGWKRIVVYRVKGQRFIGCGLGKSSWGVRIEVYGSPGDYLGSGLDGAYVVVHNSGQDQMGQIMKSGQMVIYGDVGQTFLYGAKGGEVYVLGDAAGRPLINAVGTVKVVINGTCLDYLAESFMAGAPKMDGENATALPSTKERTEWGFCIVNAIRFNSEGEMEPLREPYPGGNLLSLASGGAVFIRDPEKKVNETQLNGGKIEQITEKDWEYMLPLLKKNEALMRVRIKDLLKHHGEERKPQEIYRKVSPAGSEVLYGRLFPGNCPSRQVKED
ncbi:MAG: GltB/FmdC/FwdC-like GXGXG domain-containing protein [bacterium JZ-2024 1]